MRVSLRHWGLVEDGREVLQWLKRDSAFTFAAVEQHTRKQQKKKTLLILNCTTVGGLRAYFNTSSLLNITFERPPPVVQTAHLTSVSALPQRRAAVEMLPHVSAGQSRSLQETL